MEDNKQLVNFDVLNISEYKPGVVVVRVNFKNSDKIYSYFRKINESGNNKFVIIDGCRIVFNTSLELISITREYNTKGRVKKTTERQIKKSNSMSTIKQSNNFDEDEEDLSDWEGWEEVEDTDISDKLESEWRKIEQEELEEIQQKEQTEIEIHHNEYDTIKTCLNCGIPVYLAGPAGSGKNHTVEQIAREMGWNFYFSNSVQQEYKLTGFIDAGGDFHETEFYKACTDTKECIFFLDEIDASIPEVLVLLNAAIANGYFEFPNGRVDFDKVHFVAAGNTVGSGADEMYTGRMILDQATLDRFAIVDFDYCEEIEKKITNNNNDLITFVHDLRKTAKSNGIRATFSYRCMMMVTELESAGMPLEKIMRIVVMKGLDKDTINAFTIFSGNKNKYHEALEKIQM